mmetsp:Transcript_82824/g.230020  ORF Transcript_82824/g.230020 Transcript_82824/m.230020 type:complete len:319 (+) Transcript_82824:74-1030(+)
MYIGPWQEFKLARLIQQHHEQEQPSRRRPQLPQGSRVSVHRRRQAEQADAHDDAASVASSSRSGFSTQSAPAQLVQPSAQARLNNYYEHLERTCRRASSTDGGMPQAVRPRSSASQCSGSGTGALPPRGSGRKPPGKKGSAKASAKAKAAAFEEQRRARIVQMQRLYGLAASEESEAPQDEDGVMAKVATAPSGSTVVQSSAASGCLLGSLAQQRNAEGAPGPECSWQGLTPDADRALGELQASMDAHEPELNGGQLAQLPATSKKSADVAWSLPTLPEDPLSLSMGSSGGLIAWSKNLRPDNLSPSASLTEFFPAPV